MVIVKYGLVMDCEYHPGEIILGVFGQRANKAAFTTCNLRIRQWRRSRHSKDLHVLSKAFDWDFGLPSLPIIRLWRQCFYSIAVTFDSGKMGRVAQGWLSYFSHKWTSLFSFRASIFSFALTWRIGSDGFLLDNSAWVSGWILMERV